MLERVYIRIYNLGMYTFFLTKKGNKALNSALKWLPPCRPLRSRPRSFSSPHRLNNNILNVAKYHLNDKYLNKTKQHKRRFGSAALCLGLRLTALHQKERGRELLEFGRLSACVPLKAGLALKGQIGAPTGGQLV